ncbi:hypothetical protein FIBSPDRAFT_900392 [Athelia psychrophila]|uniref:Uncharacterized protein n=1 Tax=Athelia psychrophila TaxID=1759441 RepID=A0A165YGN7_9AGAM|nr:hypothetical protein FIBSPDRAFT_900392 [Fibularhizoctonia sp. CBS 109695]
MFHSHGSYACTILYSAERGQRRKRDSRGDSVDGLGSFVLELGLGNGLGTAAGVGLGVLKGFNPGNDIVYDGCLGYKGNLTRGDQYSYWDLNLPPTHPLSHASLNFALLVTCIPTDGTGNGVLEIWTVAIVEEALPEAASVYEVEASSSSSASALLAHGVQHRVVVLQAEAVWAALQKQQNHMYPTPELQERLVVDVLEARLRRKGEKRGPAARLALPTFSCIKLSPHEVPAKKHYLKHRTKPKTKERTKAALACAAQAPNAGALLNLLGRTALHSCLSTWYWYACVVFPPRPPAHVFGRYSKTRLTVSLTTRTFLSSTLNLMSFSMLVATLKVPVQ